MSLQNRTSVKCHDYRKLQRIKKIVSFGAPGLPLGPGFLATQQGPVLPGSENKRTIKGDI